MIWRLVVSRLAHLNQAVRVQNYVHLTQALFYTFCVLCFSCVYREYSLLRTSKVNELNVHQDDVEFGDYSRQCGQGFRQPAATRTSGLVSEFSRNKKLFLKVKRSTAKTKRFQPISTILKLQE